jgi:beta-lactamase superfamily II metal-dependent hydrolase
MRTISWLGRRCTGYLQRAVWDDLTQPPVWGIWKQNRFYFETAPNSLKGRNLSSNQSIVVHVQDGNDTVILEGTTRREKRTEALNQLRKDYLRKYQYTPDWSNGQEQIVFMVEPKIIHAWKGSANA